MEDFYWLMRRVATYLTRRVRLIGGVLTALSSPQHPENILAHDCPVQSLPKVPRPPPPGYRRQVCNLPTHFHIILRREYTKLYFHSYCKPTWCGVYISIALPVFTREMYVALYFFLTNSGKEWFFFINVRHILLQGILFARLLIC